MNQYNFNAQRPSESYHRCDMALLISMLLLWGLGLFTMFVCSQNYASRFFNNDALYFVRRQLICSGVGLILFLLFLFVDMKTIRSAVFYITIISLVLCFLTFIKPLSIEKNGARRWIRMPFNFSFQPSELIKFSLVLYLANYFDKQFQIENPEDRDVMPCVGIFMGMILLVVLQKDFSTSAFITVIGILIFFVSGAKLKWLIIFVIVALPLCCILIGSEEYRIERIIGFLKPNEGASSYNYQTNAAKNAISAGGLWGSGIGRGLSKLNSIPEVQADYIFAGWSEAMGFVGVVIYLSLLGFFAWRGYRAAFRTPSRFAAYACFGCVSVIFLQSLVNCGVVCGVLPSTGIPLPFFSVGGSSIMITLAMCGFILNASRCEEIKDDVNTTYTEINIDNLTVL
ncbi:MAG: putative lipid II flippase FtsW [Treponema sp.]|nr:putative lipid II flippase FtsW [Treponema sp.]